MMTNKILFIIFLFSFHQVFAKIPAVIAERESIRIAAFYCKPFFYLLLNPLNQDFNDASPEERKTISEQLVPAAISYYQATLKVNRRKDPIYIGWKGIYDCARVNSQKSMTDGVEADLVLLVTAYDDRGVSADHATAKSCFREYPSNKY